MCTGRVSVWHHHLLVSVLIKGLCLPVPYAVVEIFKYGVAAAHRHGTDGGHRNSGHHYLHPTRILRRAITSDHLQQAIRDEGSCSSAEDLCASCAVTMSMLALCVAYDAHFHQYDRPSQPVQPQCLR